jgi:hypothetical protein
MGLFRKAGFTVDPYPVDWRTSGWSDVYTFQSDWMTGIGLTDTAAHEWLGLIAYRLTGKIDAASFPHAAAGQVITVCDTNEPAS